MKKKNKKILFLIGYLISLGSLLLISFLLFWLLYDLEINYVYISNAFFIPNILVFFLSIGVNLGAGNVFNPLRYVFKKIFTSTKSKEAPMTYADYVEEKKKDVKNFWYITLASTTMLVVAIIFAFL